MKLFETHARKGKEEGEKEDKCSRLGSYYYVLSK